MTEQVLSAEEIRRTVREEIAAVLDEVSDKAPDRALGRVLRDVVYRLRSNR